MSTDDIPPASKDTQSDPHPMEDLLSQAYSYQEPKRGEIRTGTVVWIGPNEIVVDIGVKREAIVNSRDLERLRAEGIESIEIGTEVPVYIVKPEDQDGNIIVSIYLARRELAWQKAQAYQQAGTIYRSKVSAHNKGGLVVPFEGLPGFVPTSQVVGFPRDVSEQDKETWLAEQIGRDIVVRVIEVDRKRKRLVMSEQAAQRAWQEQQRKEFIESLEVGQVLHGVVRGLTNFGAFVDLGGVDGLVHLSELSWQPVKHPSQVVHVGDEVDVRVIHLDKEHGKIGLSLRQMQPDPWSIVEANYVVGQRVRGTITNLADFGAFVRLEIGVEALAHLSELSDTEIRHPSEVVTPGKTYLFEIIRIDPERRRIGLSLRRIPAHEREVVAG
ncbi:MAG: 30S ribosomal protein S1 [Anaerolineae bacterium]